MGAWRRHEQVSLIGAIALLLVIGVVVYAIRQSSKTSALSERRIAMRAMGEYLRRTTNPKCVLLISNPFSQKRGRPPEVYSFQESSEIGLREGLGSGVQVHVDFPELKREAASNPQSVFVDPTTKTPLSFMVAEDSFDKLIQMHSNCDVVVSLIGVPVNIGAMPAWIRPGAPRFALLLPDFRLIGDGAIVRSAFKSGKLAAAIVPKPGALSGGEITSDYKAEFDKRFILVTAENVDASMPALFR